MRKHSKACEFAKNEKCTCSCDGKLHQIAFKGKREGVVQLKLSSFGGANGKEN